MNTLRKILIVDDDPVVGKSFDRVLSGRGYAVVTASDGAEALRKIAAESYDAVFTDIRMPGMEASLLPRDQAGSPGFRWIVSGYATPENEARVTRPVSAVLHKPLSPEMIENAPVKRSWKDTAAPAANDSPLAGAVATVEPLPEAARAWVRNGRTRVGAPLLGLAYVVVLPFVGLAALIALPLWYGGKALWKRAGPMKTWIRNVALLFAAPFLGLAYVIALPFVGMGMLAGMGVGGESRKCVGLGAGDAGATVTPRRGGSLRIGGCTPVGLSSGTGTLK
jgi:CheY-like chemotaxis protein